MKKQRGFTLVELLVVIVFVVISILIITLPMWNCFYSEQGVMQQLKSEALVSPIAKMVRTERHIWKYSRIYVTDASPSSPEGRKMMFYLDTNIFYNYRFIPVATKVVKTE